MFDLKKLIRTNINALQPYSSARNEYSSAEGVFLDANENPYGQWNRYPDPYQTALKAELAKQKGINPNQILVGNGSDEIIDLLFRVFCIPGTDKALGFTPSYGMYAVSAAINDVELVTIPLTDSFDLDSEAAIELLKQKPIKLTFICSPNNPSGNAFTQAKIREVVQAAQGIVVLDEAYADFSEQGSWLELLPQFPNLVITQTMSKARGLAAARVGFAFASEEIIAVLNKVKPPYNVSELNQQTVLAALRNEESFAQQLEQIKNEKRKLERELALLPLVRKVYPSNANFLLVEVTDANRLYAQLVERNIIVRNRHKEVPNCIRISIGSATENEILLNALKQIENEESTVY